MPASQASQEILNRAVRFWSIFVKAALTLLAFLFLHSNWSQLPTPTLNGRGAYIILKLTLSIYLYCWFFGCRRDLNVKNDVLISAPKPTKDQVAIALLFVVGFGFLFYTESPTLLSSVFIVFLTLNVGGWAYLKRLERPFIKQATAYYRCTEDDVGKEKLAIYNEYMFGHWQSWRFLIGLSLLAILALTAFGVKVLPLDVCRDVMFALIIFLTVTTLESWIWYRRLRLKIEWDQLNSLNDRGLIRGIRT